MERYFSSSELSEIAAYNNTAGAQKLQSNSAVLQRETQAFLNAQKMPLMRPIFEKYNARVKEIVLSGESN